MLFRMIKEITVSRGPFRSVFVVFLYVTKVFSESRFEVLKTEFELQNDFITQGAIIRTRATWYEQGEKSNKYFLNLENSSGKKSSIRKIFMEDESSTSNPQVIMKELRSFYSNLYKKGANENSEILTDLFIEDLHLPKLTSDQRERCDGKLSVGECFNTLKTFQRNRSPSRLPVLPMYNFLQRVQVVQ